MEQKYLAGTKPGTGRYKCIKCPYIIELKEGEILPICPMCGFDEYVKI